MRLALSDHLIRSTFNFLTIPIIKTMLVETILCLIRTLFVDSFRTASGFFSALLDKVLSAYEKNFFLVKRKMCLKDIETP